MKVICIEIAIAQRIVTFHETIGNLGLEELKQIKKYQSQSLREKRSFHEMETPWKPCGIYRLIVSI